jgi:16S rRNA (cytosine1402-N4)-methyltransferase
LNIVHMPVMAPEVLDYLAPLGGEGLLVDCTLGEGGHSQQFLQNFPFLRIIGLDADRSIQAVAKDRLQEYSERIEFRNQWFDDFFLNFPAGMQRPDRILIDLGISVFHYEKGRRGFSFREEGELDMRLNRDSGPSALDILRETGEEELANIIFQFGEERYSRRIARAIVQRREIVFNASELAQIIWDSVPPPYRRGRIHPATRTFQALRIAVNDELGRLDRVLEGATRVLKPGGRLGIITFHSLEDRRVKHYFRELSKVCVCPPEQMRCTCERIQRFRILTKKPLTASSEEIAVNAPSRSAKFRVIEKLEDQ